MFISYNAQSNMLYTYDRMRITILQAKEKFPSLRFSWHPAPKNSWNFDSPRKSDFRHSEAKSACFNASFVKNVYLVIWLWAFKNFKNDWVPLIFLQVFDVSCFNLGARSNPPGSFLVLLNVFRVVEKLWTEKNYLTQHKLF